MSTDETIKTTLEEKFPFLAGQVAVTRKGRIFVQCPEDRFRPVFDFSIKELSFSGLSAISGMDEGDHFAVMYHLNRDGNGLLNIRIKLAREKPAVHTVTDVFPAADIYEREMVDLLGISVDGLEPGHRYPLPDHWPKNSHPLRKDWKQKKDEKDSSV